MKLQWNGVEAVFVFVLFCNSIDAIKCCISNFQPKSCRVLFFHDISLVLKPFNDSICMRQDVVH